MKREEIAALSFDCVLPACIFFNGNLEPNCIKLYAIIRNLTKMHGYCYATNKYLSDLCACDMRSIQRWIGSLEVEGYLEKETLKKGISWQRRLYLSDKFKKFLRKDRNVIQERQKNHGGVTKMSHIKNKEKYMNEEYPPPLVPNDSTDNPSSVSGGDAPPTPEEEEEIFRRLKDRKDKSYLPKIGSETRWLKQALFELRAEESRRMALESSRINERKRFEEYEAERKKVREKHFKEASERFGTLYKGWLVEDGGNGVTFSKDGKTGFVEYGISEEEWRQRIGWKHKNS